MSYEARGSGAITMNRPVAEIPEDVIVQGRMAFTEVEHSPDNGLWLTHEYGRYHEDEIIGFLEKMAPYTVSGKIEFIGEDDAIWRFVWDRGKWQEQSGRIVYEPANRNERHSERLEILGCMADIVEDWLESKGITADDIPCEDRDQAIADGEDPEDCAIIYGEDYDHLTGDFEELLINCGLIEREAH